MPFNKTEIVSKYREKIPLFFMQIVSTRLNLKIYIYFYFEKVIKRKCYSVPVSDLVV